VLAPGPLCTSPPGLPDLPGTRGEGQGIAQALIHEIRGGSFETSMKRMVRQQVALQPFSLWQQAAMLARVSP